MSIPISQFIPPSPFPPLVSICLFSTSLSLFLPCKQVHLYHFSRCHMYALIYDRSRTLSILVIQNFGVLQRYLLQCPQLLLYLFTKPPVIQTVRGEGMPKEDSYIFIYTIPWDTKFGNKYLLCQCVLRQHVLYPDASKGILNNGATLLILYLFSFIYFTLFLLYFISKNGKHSNS